MEQSTAFWLATQHAQHIRSVSERPVSQRTKHASRCILAMYASFRTFSLTCHALPRRRVLISVCTCELHAFPHQDAVLYLCTCCFPWRRAWPTQNKVLTATDSARECSAEVFLRDSNTSNLPHAVTVEIGTAVPNYRSEQMRNNISVLFQPLVSVSVLSYSSILRA